MVNMVNISAGEHMEGVEEIVHIIPLGHEIDRAVRPFDELKANRVHLLAVTETFEKYSEEMIKKQRRYLNIVREKLEEKGIQVQSANIDMFNLLEVMGKIAEIIREEKERNNLVYVNMSASGRLNSVGATLAAMVHGAKVYYVEADGYAKDEEKRRKHGISICRNLKLKYLENFEINLPDETGQKILVKLCLKPKGMKTKEIIDFLNKEGVEGFESQYKNLTRGQTQKYLMKLNRGILDKLEADGYITRVRLGRYNTIKITESGRYVAYISGLMDRVL